MEPRHTSRSFFSDTGTPTVCSISGSGTALCTVAVVASLGRDMKIWRYQRSHSLTQPHPANYPCASVASHRTHKDLHHKLKPPHSQPEINTYLDISVKRVRVPGAITLNLKPEVAVLCLSPAAPSKRECLVNIVTHAQRSPTDCIHGARIHKLETRRCECWLKNGRPPDVYVCRPPTTMYVHQSYSPACDRPHTLRVFIHHSPDPWITALSSSIPKGSLWRLDTTLSGQKLLRVGMSKLNGCRARL